MKTRDKKLLLFIVIWILILAALDGCTCDCPCEDEQDAMGNEFYGTVLYSAGEGHQG